MHDSATPATFYFQVSMADNANATEAVFQEVSGLQAKRDAVSIVEGDENRFKYRLPVGAKHDNLILKRGLLPLDAMLVKWCRNTLESGLGTEIEIRDMAVALVDLEGLPVAQWMITAAYPVNWRVASLRTEDGTIVIEAIELAYTTATRVL
ncbi:MAG: phage tail protein [Bacteroidota bacterium]